MAQPTFYTFTVTIADPEQCKAEHVRDAIKEALEDHADFMVIDMDHGEQLVLTGLD